MISFLAKYRYLSITLLCMVTWVMLSSIAFHSIWSNAYFSLYPLIPISYLIYLCTALILVASHSSLQHLSVKWFALYKGVKLLLSIVALLSIAFVHPLHFKACAIAILTNYLIYLIADTLIFRSMTQIAVKTSINSINNEVAH